MKVLYLIYKTILRVYRGILALLVLIIEFQINILVFQLEVYVRYMAWINFCRIYGIGNFATLNKLKVGPRHMDNSLGLRMFVKRVLKKKKNYSLLDFESNRHFVLFFFFVFIKTSENVIAFTHISSNIIQTEYKCVCCYI